MPNGAVSACPHSIDLTGRRSRNLTFGVAGGLVPRIDSEDQFSKRHSLGDPRERSFSTCFWYYCRADGSVRCSFGAPELRRSGGAWPRPNRLSQHPKQAGRRRGGSRIRASRRAFACFANAAAGEWLGASPLRGQAVSPTFGCACRPGDPPRLDLLPHSSPGGRSDGLASFRIHDKTLYDLRKLWPDTPGPNSFSGSSHASALLFRP